MGKANDSIKYNRSYPEFNGTDEGMIQHKERSGAKAAALIPTTTFVASATAAMLLLLLALARIALVRPALLTVTTNSAQVEVRTDLEGSEDAYPLVYLLVPYEPGQRDPVTPGGRLRLSEQEVEALGDPVLQGEIYTRVEQLLFQGLDNRFDYLLLFCSEDENGELVLRREALYIRMVRIGDPDSPNRPGPIPDDSTPKGPVAIAITPAPATPAPDPATPPQTATSSATATATSSATATATSTATATPYDETTPYIPPTDDSTPTPVVPHGITIRIIGGGQGFAGTDPEHLSSASELQANPGETVYIKGVPEDTDDVHYLFARYEVTSGSVSNWTSSSFVMGSTDVELTFTFVRAYRLSIVNEMPAWGTATYQGGYQDFPAGETVNIHCSPKNGGSFVSAWDDEEEFFFDNPDFSFTMPERDVYMIVEFEPLLYDLTVITDGSGDCSVSDYFYYDGEYDVYKCEAGSTVIVSAGANEDNALTAFYVNGESVSFDPAHPEISIPMDGDKTVEAVFKPLHTIRFANDMPSYGTITCNGLSADEDHPAISVKAAEGQTVTFTLTPKTGCEVGTVEVDPSGGGTLSSSGSTYTFTVGTGNATIYVYFDPKPGHQIHVSTIPDEDFLSFEISADIYGVDDTFPPGATVTITPELEGPYAYDHMVVNGGSYSNQPFYVNPVTITMPDADVYVTIYFTEITYHSINVSGTEGCAGVSPSWRPDLAPGDSVNITWEAETGYEFSSWSVTGTDDYSLNSDKTGGTVVMGDADVNVTVYFVEKESYSITLNEILPSSDAASYSISPGPNAPDERYYEGTHITITATANPGYELDSIVAGTHSSSNSPLEFDIADNTGVVIYCHSLTPVTVSQPDAFGGSTYTGTTYHEPGSVFYVSVFPDSGCTFYLTVDGEAYAPGVSGVPVGTEPMSVIVTFIPQ